MDGGNDNMTVKKLIAGFLVVALVLTTLIGCGGSQPTPIKLVPQAANLVAQVQISKLLNDKDLINSYNNASKGANEPKTVQEALDELSQKTGLNLRDFSQVLLFGDVNKMEQPDSGYLGIIAQGTFNEKQFIQNIENNTGKKLNVSDYKGYQLYTNNSDQYSLVFFGSNMLVFGSEQAVKDSADVHKGDKQPLSGSIINTYNRLGATAIKAAFAFPAEAQKALESEVPGGSPISTKSFSKMDMIGLSFDKLSQDLTLKIDLHFLDLKSVQDAKDTISGTITLLKGVTPTPEIKNLLGKIEFTSSDVWLTISLNTTFSEIESLSKSLPIK
jgi:hypothetical protein